jgi:hypothetical protein
MHKAEKAAKGKLVTTVMSNMGLSARWKQRAAA